jgi:hypothetical protein
MLKLTQRFPLDQLSEKGHQRLRKTSGASLNASQRPLFKIRLEPWHVNQVGLFINNKCYITISL